MFNLRRPLIISIIQSVVRWFFRIVMVLFYRIRVHQLENYPSSEGGDANERLLICANHQSFLDPIVLGVVCPRPVNYLARKTLFKFLPLSIFLHCNDSIPIDREATGLSGVKETLRRLKRNEAVVMFPEGTRSRDGELQTFMSGFCLLAKRSKATLMPVGLAGCFEAYPPHRLLPQPGAIHAVMGEPIRFEEYAELSDEETTLLLAERIQACFDEARRRREGIE